MNFSNRFINGIAFLSLRKGRETFVFKYTEATKPELLRTFGRFAADPDIWFTWYDAAVCSSKVRGTECEVNQ